MGRTLRRRKRLSNKNLRRRKRLTNNTLNKRLSNKSKKKRKTIKKSKNIYKGGMFRAGGGDDGGGANIDLQTPNLDGIVGTIQNYELQLGPIYDDIKNEIAKDAGISLVHFACYNNRCGDKKILNKAIKSRIDNCCDAHKSGSFIYSTETNEICTNCNGYKISKLTEHGSDTDIRKQVVIDSIEKYVSETDMIDFIVLIKSKNNSLYDKIIKALGLLDSGPSKVDFTSTMRERKEIAEKQAEAAHQASLKSKEEEAAQLAAQQAKTPDELEEEGRRRDELSAAAQEKQVRKAQLRSDLARTKEETKAEKKEEEKLKEEHERLIAEQKRSSLEKNAFIHRTAGFWKTIQGKLGKNAVKIVKTWTHDEHSEALNGTNVIAGFLKVAIHKEDLKVIKAIVNYNDNHKIVNIFPHILLLAVAINNNDIVEFILSVVRENTILNAVFSNGTVDMTPLIEAINNNNIKLVNLLVKKGADINLEDIHKETPLHRALYEPVNILIVINLVNLGADIYARNKSGETPLGKLNKMRYFMELSKREDKTYALIFDKIKDKISPAEIKIDESFMESVFPDSGPVNRKAWIKEFHNHGYFTAKDLSNLNDASKFSELKLPSLIKEKLNFNFNPDLTVPEGVGEKIAEKLLTMSSQESNPASASATPPPPDTPPPPAVPLLARPLPEAVKNILHRDAQSPLTDEEIQQVRELMRKEGIDDTVIEAVIDERTDYEFWGE